MCSPWRKVALHTPELWSDTHLNYPVDHPGRLISLHQRWLARKRKFPVSRRMRELPQLAKLGQTILFYQGPGPCAAAA